MGLTILGCVSGFPGLSRAITFVLVFSTHDIHWKIIISIGVSLICSVCISPIPSAFLVLICFSSFLSDYFIYPYSFFGTFYCSGVYQLLDLLDITMCISHFRSPFSCFITLPMFFSIVSHVNILWEVYPFVFLPRLWFL